MFEPDFDGGTHYLFATPVARYRCEERALLAELQTLALNGESGPARLNASWAKYNLLESPAPCVRDLLLRVISPAFEEFARKHILVDSASRGRMSLHGWFNVNRLGDGHRLHNHPHCHISGVFYVAVPEASPDLSLMDPRFNANMCLSGDFQGSDCEVLLRVQPGDLILFPSYLWHCVIPNRTPEPRISIAINATMVPSQA